MFTYACRLQCIYKKMQHNGVDTEHNYVNMRDNYVNIMRPNMIMLPVAIIHISHGFEGDIPEYQPRGDTKALTRYATRCRRHKNKNKNN